jgi:polyisoprenoid-binding protein YceI
MHMTNRWVSAALIVSLSCATMACSSVLAQITPTPSTQRAKIPAGTYNLDNSHTSILFELSHLGFSSFVGRFRQVSGILSYDPKNVEQSQVDIKVDGKSIDTNSPVLDKKLVGAEGFDFERFPEMRFTSKSLKIINERQGQLAGDLSFRGVTRPVVLDVTFNGGATSIFSGAYTLGFQATTTIKRSDWGLKSWLPLVGDDVKLTINTEFNKAS